MQSVEQKQPTRTPHLRDHSSFVSEPKNFFGHKNFLPFLEEDSFQPKSGDALERWGKRHNRGENRSCLTPFREITHSLYRGHKGRINSLAIDGDVVFSSATDETIKQWNLDGRMLQTFNASHAVERIKVVGQRLFVCTFDALCREWALATGECLQLYAGHCDIVTDVACSKSVVYTSSVDKTVIAFNSDTGAILYTFSQHSDVVSCLALTGTTLFSAGHDGDVIAWNTLNCSEPGKHLQSGKQDSKPRSQRLSMLQNLQGGRHVLQWQNTSVWSGKTHKDWVTCLAIDRHLLFTGSMDSRIMWFDTNTLQSLGEFFGHLGGVLCMQISNNLLFSGSMDHRVLCWSLEAVYDYLGDSNNTENTDTAGCSTDNADNADNADDADNALDSTDKAVDKADKTDKADKADKA
eukprot:CAMPEP_0175157216 /NCGR_PEP_ID=MMETSP0087-20121206/22073_1 /TAXON_ID=136419 /ORGANISM="Unknown Unknown, Strain D1" /LENGTH=406 /DNA_ID=CAMNT_0016444789 /DNA_START=19 /DNA_END=1236 /DNA_ORIENTATION=-